MRRDERGEQREDVAPDSGIAELVLYEDEDIAAVALLQENYLDGELLSDFFIISFFLLLF